MHKRVLTIILISLIIMSLIVALFFFHKDAEADSTVINYFGGPNTISKMSPGTWYIGVNTLTWTRVYYKIDWGDGDNGKDRRESKASVTPGTRQIPLTHTYSNTGNYTISLIIKNRLGQVQKESLQVSVIDPNEVIDPLTPDTNFVAPNTINSSSTNCFIPWSSQYVVNGSNGILETQLNFDYRLSNYPGLPPNPATYSCSNGQLSICNSANNCKKFNIKHSDPNNQCAEDVLTCPDGSFSERVGPTCDFKACPIVSNTSSGLSCKTRWGDKTVANGAYISSEPWFTNGQHSLAAVIPMMRCLNSSWQVCDYLGNNCTNFTPVY